MTNIKAWALRLLSIAALGGIFAPWHHAPATAAIPTGPVVVDQQIAKTQDRWVPTQLPPIVEATTDIQPPAPVADPTQPVKAPMAAPTKAAHPKAAHRAKRRPQRHVLGNTEPADNSWAATAFRAAAKQAGALH